jgi:hypothetical protein
LQELTKLLAELAVDDAGHEDMWTIDYRPINIVVSAATRELYADEVTAWEGARSLWRAVLDLGYVLTDEGHSEIGATRRPDQDSGADSVCHLRDHWLITRLSSGYTGWRGTVLDRQGSLASTGVTTNAGPISHSPQGSFRSLSTMVGTRL